MSKKCYYHQDYGHTTGQCFKLMENIEKWVHDRYLKHYVSGYYQQGWDIDMTDYRRTSNRDNDQRRDGGKNDIDESSCHIINTIIGAIKEWATSKRRKENHLHSM